MPNPYPGESKKNYLKRCIPMLIKDEGRKQKQSIAICMNMFDRYVSKNGHVNTENTYYLINNFNENLIQEDLKDKLQKVVGVKNITTGLISSDPISLSIGLAQVSNKNSTSLNSADQKINHHINQNLISKLKKPSPAKLAKFDDRSINNKINTRPQGVIITDTVNNPIFPLGQPIIDTAKFNLPDIKKRSRHSDRLSRAKACSRRKLRC